MQGSTASSERPSPPAHLVKRAVAPYSDPHCAIRSSPAGDRNQDCSRGVMMTKASGSRVMGPELGRFARAIPVALSLGCLLAFALLTPWRPAAAAQDGSEAMEVEAPTGHIALDNPADLSDERAEAVYQEILKEMIGGYRMSGIPAADNYGAWPRFNRAPYRSAQHGERFVNNYTNGIGQDYGRFEAVGRLPVGAILVKDSFTVTENGEVFGGALFVMEKMPKGFNPPSRDWRYSMIMPDGSLLGETGGDGADEVEFCITCHELAGDAHDHLFFIPEAYRN